ncbi:MAG: uracil-DNA glycosylase [Piscinibacter sp.]|nr:uracil-DNA glycosylase [Piscinibacter sp.]
MRWSERQRNMLAEMGIRVWASEPEAVLAEPADEVREPEPVVVATRRAAPPAASPVGAAPSMPAPVARPVAGNVAGSRPEGVAAMDWAALREAVAGCTACKLCQGRRQTVFGVGNPNAQWMVVGEAPGEQEDRQGEPFVGKSGQLLDNMLRAIGLTRATDDPARQVYIANTIKCRPPGNRNPEPEELAQCEPFLIRQVELVQPRIILAMGRFAVQSLLRSNEAIGRLRGRVHRYQGVPLIVTYHPAYLLRNLEEKARAWDDLCLARQTFETQTPGAA